MATASSNQGVLNTSDDLLLCRACGTQYDVKNRDDLNSCRVCDDPRQYVPPSGHSFTTLKELREDSAGYHLNFKQEEDEKIWAFTVEPKVGIGQRAFIIQTPQGNIMWDCVCYLDEAAVKMINSIGGIKMIVISHPHFYTTWPDWSSTFNCPVYLAAADKEWINRKTPATADLRLLDQRHNELLPGITSIIAGGHFPGSSMLHLSAENASVPSLFHADTIMAVPSALDPNPGRPGVVSYSFMWSYPNQIPLDPDQIHQIWQAMKGFDIEATYGFTTVRARAGHQISISERVLESAKIVVSKMGHANHPIFAETL